MNKPLILVGGGGHCKSVIEAAESAGYNILGVLDVAENVGKNIAVINADAVNIRKDMSTEAEAGGMWP